MHPSNQVGHMLVRTKQISLTGPNIAIHRIFCSIVQVVMMMMLMMMMLMMMMMMMMMMMIKMMMTTVTNQIARLLGVVVVDVLRPERLFDLVVAIIRGMSHDLGARTLHSPHNT
jgi:hypothetical protein